MMKFYNEDDLTDENFEKYCQEIEEIRERAKKKAQMLVESPPPKFKTLEEFAHYHNAIPFVEWEKKMMERLGLKSKQL